MKPSLKKILAISIITLYSFGTVVFAQDLTSTHFIIEDPSIGTGGGYQSSGSFTMYSAGNLNISGNGGTSTSFEGRDGFLQFPQVTAGTLSAIASGSTINLTWGATTVADGYTVSGYNIGIASVTGGPYTFTSIGNTLSHSYTGLTPGSYFFVLQTLDTFGNIITTSNEATAVILESVGFSLSSNSISFGQLSSSAPRYATTLSGGSSSLTAAHTITVSSTTAGGYTINYDGPTVTSGSNTIAPATISGSSTGTPGSNQFALSLSETGGSSVSSTYDQASQNWDFTPNAQTPVDSASGPISSDTLSAYYIANTSPLTPPGTYNTTLTYEMTANY